MLIPKKSLRKRKCMFGRRSFSSSNILRFDESHQRKKVFNRYISFNQSWRKFCAHQSHPKRSLCKETLSLYGAVLLCSWDKSLNIGNRMLRIFLKVHSFTFDHLNCVQPIVWDMKCIMTLSWDHVMQESISGKFI